jgi:hypothetical protein
MIDRKSTRSRRATVIRLAAAAAALISCGGGDSPSSPSKGGDTSKPVTRPEGAILLNDTLTRTISAALASDTLRFTAIAGQRIHIDVQQSDTGFVSQSLTWALIDPATGLSIDAGSSRLPSGALGLDIGDRDLTWKRLAAAGTYLLIATSHAFAPARAFSGAFRVRLIGSNPAPEHAAARVVPGDSISESIDVPGDVDEFYLKAPKGTSVFLFVRATTGRSADTLIVERGGDNTFENYPYNRSPGTDTRPDGAVVGPLSMDADSVRIRIRGGAGSTVGSYSLKLYQFNKAPEGVSSTLTVGDTVSSSIEFNGDIDEYTFIGAPGQWYSVAVQPTTGRAQDRLTFQVSRVGVGDPLLATFSGNTPTLLGQMSTRFLGGAEVTVRVNGLVDGMSKGAYRLAVIALDPRPETGSATFAIGDTVSGALEIPADFDEYQFQANKGDLLVMYLQGTTPDSSGYVQLIADSLGIQSYGTPQDVFAWDNRLPLRARMSARAVAPATATYKVRVQGYGGFHAGYRFSVVRISTQPEVASTTLTANLPVLETSDPPGDIDRFFFNGVAGQKVVAYLQILPPTAGETVDGSGFLAFFYPTGGAFLASGSPEPIGSAGTVPITLPSTNAYPVDVEARSPTGRAVPYRLMIYPVNPPPEIVAADIKIGDKITNETLWPSSDMDEFRLTGAAGAKFKACVRNRLSPSSPPNETIWLQVTGAGELLITSKNPDTEATCTVPTMLTSSGQATIRVFTRAFFSSEVIYAPGSTGAYDIEIVSVP